MGEPKTLKHESFRTSLIVRRRVHVVNVLAGEVQSNILKPLQNESIPDSMYINLQAKLWYDTDVDRLGHGPDEQEVQRKFARHSER